MVGDTQVSRLSAFPLDRNSYCSSIPSFRLHRLLVYFERQVKEISASSSRVRKHPPTATMTVSRSLLRSSKHYNEILTLYSAERITSLLPTPTPRSHQRRRLQKSDGPPHKLHELLEVRKFNTCPFAVVAGEPLVLFVACNYMRALHTRK